MTTSDISTENESRPKLKAKDYKSALKPVWCAGCGNYAVLSALTQALAELELPPYQVAVISGIGCSSRLPGYLSTYGFNALHGRAVPIAIGVKLANPSTTVIAAGGDGDGFSIGGGHLSHAARRNVDMAYLVMDNRIYGLTKGQMSPTTPLEAYTSTTSYGSYDPPVNMVGYMLAYGAGFIARGFAGALKQLTALIKEAILYKGFGFVQIMSPCVTYWGNEEYQAIKQASAELPDGYDPSSRKAAWEIAEDTSKLYMGVIYRDDTLPSYEERISRMREVAAKSGVKPLDRLIEEFRP